MLKTACSNQVSAPTYNGYIWNDKKGGHLIELCQHLRLDSLKSLVNEYIYINRNHCEYDDLIMQLVQAS